MSTPEMRSVPAWRRVWLPKETGAWGVLGETVLAGVLAAAAWPAVLAAAGLIALFFLRQPVRLLLLPGLARGRPALVAGALAALAAAGLGGAAMAGAWAALLPLGPLALLGLYQLRADQEHQGRQLWPQLAGAVGLTAGAATLLVAGGRAWPAALLLWGCLALRHLVTIPFVRWRLRQQRGQGGSGWVELALHAGALLLALAGQAAGWWPWPVATAFALLAARAAHGWWTRTAVLKPAALGYRELTLGLLCALLFGLGLR